MRCALPVLALAVAGCFTDMPTPSGCPDGSAGCPCEAGGACGAGLECRDPGVCVDEDCTPGVRDCVCDDGTCGVGLVCNDNGACVDTTATGDGTGMPPPVTDDGATSVASVDADPTVMTTGMGGSSSDTGSGPLSCPVCIITMVDHEACSDQWMSCQLRSRCVDLLQCAADCAGPGPGPAACLAGCCNPDGGGSPTELYDLLVCGLTHCTEACAGQELPKQCSPGG